MHTRSIHQMLDDMARGEYSAVELTKHYLARLDRLEPSLHAFITTTPELALAQAEAADRARRQGETKPLLGIPIAHKDIFCTEGVLTTAGSRMLGNFVSPYDATVVTRLRDAGAVMLGKTNMDEFGMGSSTEHSAYGNTHNPWDPNVVPGGSSGGSAAAVAARVVPAATGTDTGGSIRQPAALCGVTGIKPTYGRVSRWGMIAYASSLDQAGPITVDAADAALMLRAMSGFDEKDSTSSDSTVPDYCESLGRQVKGLRIGMCREYFAEGLDSDSAQLIQAALGELEKLGAIVSEISLPNTRSSIPSYYVIAPAECSTNLARFDGVRFGHRCENPVDIEDLYMRSRSEGFGEEVKQRILVGTFALCAGYYDAYYRKAQQIRRLIKNDFVDAFQKVDVIIGPVSPAPAFAFGDKSGDPVAMYLQDIYTIACNLAGLPAMSIPVGFSAGLPVGMQLIGSYLNEEVLLRLAHQYQQQTDWHLQLPPLATGDQP